MLFTIILYTVLSFIFILLTHKLYEYFKDNLTVQREKDIIHQPTEAYNKIYEVLKTQQQEQTEAIADKHKMKDELKNYLNELKKDNTTSLDDLPQSL